MADNYSFKDAGGSTLTHASEEISAGVHASKHVDVDDAGVAIAKAEDAAHVSGDKGVMALAVRKDSAAAVAGTDGDYTPLIVNSSGLLHVTPTAAGDVAHDAADSGNPLKIGGKAASQYGVPTAVSGSDRVDALFDVYGRLRVVPESIGATLLLTPATPAPTTPFTSDIRNISESVIQATDLTIRDNGTHAFVIPMIEKGYRSLTVTYQNGSAIWSHAPTITIYGVIRSGGSPAFILVAKLAEWTGDLNNNTYHSFGSTDVSDIGGLAGITPARTTGLDYYAIPAITDGWSHVAMVWKFGSAPSTGEIQRISITRMGF